MSLEKQTTIDSIEVISNGCVLVRIKTSILENNQQISETHQRNVIDPGSDYSGEDARVQAICAAVHTPEVVAAYQAMLAANRPEPVNEAG